MASDALCRLCGASTTLRRSHVIPEFIYQPMYDEKHRFFALDKREAWRAKPVQKGLSERMLCDRCERFFSKFEKYAAEVMSGRSSATLRQSRDRIWVSGLDYGRFKLFLLSILWRASVSNLEFFKLVSLGPHEDKIKSMLIEERPRRSEEYGCAVIFYRLRGEEMTDTMFNPEPFRWSGRRFTKFYFGGACWCFCCDNQPPTAHLRRLYLQEDGTFMGLKMDLQDAWDFADAAKAIVKRRFLV